MDRTGNGESGGARPGWRARARRGLAALPWVVFAAGAAHLVWGAWQVAFSPSMDYAIVVEMARNMAAGADFPVFFYGQSYMGSLEPAASALFCFLFGPHPFCVCLGTAAFAVAALFVVLRAARRLGGDVGAALALVLAVCGGPYWFHFMVSPRGGYALAVLLAVSALEMGALCDFADAGGRVRPWRAALVGFLAGLAFWNFWLALPAFAAAGLVLLHRMGRRLFSWRFLLPAAVAFFAGSAPWWVWLLGNGVGALDMGDGPAPLKLQALREIVLIVLPRFFCESHDAGVLWRGPIPWVLGAMAAFSALAAWRAAEGLRRFLAATALFTAFFLFAYCYTSFGTMHVARYFTVLVPPWAVAAGAALGSALAGKTPPHGRATSRPLRLAAAALLVAYATLVAPSTLARSNRLVTDLRAQGRSWASAVNAAAADPAFAQPAFAAHTSFGANWASDRKLCLVSPIRWRYRPYLDKLEQSESPVVAYDFLDFPAFCAATGGKHRRRRVAGIPVSDEIHAPAERRELPPRALAEVRAGGADVRDALFDDDLATAAELDGVTRPSIEVVFAKPRVVCGVRGIVARASAVVGWRAEAIGENGEVAKVLSRESPHRGWFWSGPRPYLFGPDSAWELRWKPQRLSRVRIVFESRDANARGGAFALSLADLRFLAKETLPPLDADAVAEAVAAIRERMPSADLHAGRWLANRLGAKPDPALELGIGASSLAFPAVCRHATVHPACGAIVVLRGDAAEAAAGTLGATGLQFSRKEAGGCSVFAIAPTARPGSQTLRFYGGRLLRDSHADGRTASGQAPAGGEVSFGAKWRISPDVAALPETLSPGGTISLPLAVAAGPDCRARDHAHLFVHLVRNGKIVAVGTTEINGGMVMVPADAPQPGRTAVKLAIPQGLAPGPVKVELCVKQTGALLRLKPTGKGFATDRRRIVLCSPEVR